MIKLSELFLVDQDTQITPEIDFTQLKKDVSHNAAKLTSESVFIVEKSSYSFLVGFMAALYAGCRIVLPPGDKPSVIAKINSPQMHVELGGSEKFTFPEIFPDDCQLDFYTSGSTGEAQCVSKNLRQIEKELFTLEEMWGETLKKSLALSTVSHQHIYGMWYKVLWSVCAGRPFYDSCFEYWEELIPHMTSNCFIVSSPAHLSRFSNFDLPYPPKIIFTAGGPISYEAIQNTERVFLQVPTEIFGSTETGGIAYRQQTTAAIAWTPFKPIKTKIGKDDLLSVLSPFVEDEGWYQTSDRVEFVDENHFVLKGRADQVVKVEGKRVSLTEIERTLLQLTWIDDACALVTEDERKSLAAVVVLNEIGCTQLQAMGSFRLGQTLRQQMRMDLEPAALPRRWRFVDKIPVNSLGKRLKSDIVSLYSDPTGSWNTSRTQPVLHAQRIENTSIELDLSAPNDLFQFIGHFPELPILPGVCQLDWAVHYAREQFSLVSSLSQVVRLKFKSLLRPERGFTLKLDYQVEKNSVAFSYFNKEKTFSSGTLLFD